MLHIFIFLTVFLVIIHVFLFTIFETSKGGIITTSNSSVKNLIVFWWISFCNCLIFFRIRKIALSTRNAFFFFRFEVEDASLSFFDMRLSICLHKQKICPISYSPILSTPFVEKYHVNGVQTPTSACVSQTCFCVSYTQ